MTPEAQAALEAAQATEPKVETPATPTPETPAEPAPTAEAKPETPEAKPEAELFELPDGRKVDGSTLAKEWKENFMPDYTKKSQTLAQLTKAVTPEAEPKPELPKWKDPNWEPQTYAEIIEAAKLSLKDEQAAEQRQKEEQQAQVNSWIDGQLAEIRKIEPNVSEDLLFQHANKYKFSDLVTAFQNMKDTNLAIKKTEQKVLQNIQKREEPIAGKPGAGMAPSGIDYNFISSSRESANEYLARIKG